MTLAARKHPWNPRRGRCSFEHTPQPTAPGLPRAVRCRACRCGLCAAEVGGSAWLHLGWGRLALAIPALPPGASSPAPKGAARRAPETCVGGCGQRWSGDRSRRAVALLPWQKALCGSCRRARGSRLSRPTTVSLASSRPRRRRIPATGPMSASATRSPRRSPARARRTAPRGPQSLAARDHQTTAQRSQASRRLTRAPGPRARGPATPSATRAPPRPGSARRAPARARPAPQLGVGAQSEHARGVGAPRPVDLGAGPTTRRDRAVEERARGNNLVRMRPARSRRTRPRPARGRRADGAPLYPPAPIAQPAWSNGRGFRGSWSAARPSSRRAEQTTGVAAGATATGDVGPRSAPTAARHGASPPFRQGARARTPEHGPPRRHRPPGEHDRGRAGAKGGAGLPDRARSRTATPRGRGARGPSQVRDNTSGAPTAGPILQRTAVRGPWSTRSPGRRAPGATRARARCRRRQPPRPGWCADDDAGADRPQMGHAAREAEDAGPGGAAETARPEGEGRPSRRHPTDSSAATSSATTPPRGPRLRRWWPGRRDGCPRPGPWRRRRGRTRAATPGPARWRSRSTRPEGDGDGHPAA